MMGAPMMDLNQPGPALRHLRATRFLRQADVADRASISAPMLSRYECGKRLPHLDTLAAILDALDVSLVDLHRAMVCPRRPTR